MIHIEDLDHIGGRSLGHHIKLWADKYAVQANVKGASLWLRHEILIVSSNYSIEEIFGQDEDRQTKMQQQKDTTLSHAIKSRFEVKVMAART